MKTKNEEWSTEAPVGVDWSFLGEVINSALSPNFLNPSQPTLGNLSVERDEEEIKKILLLQEWLVPEDVKFAQRVEEDIYSIFYEWLTLRGEKIRMNEIKECGMGESISQEITKIKKTIGRPRPYLQSPAVMTVFECSDRNSFPSKTTIEGYMISSKLAKKYPHLEESLNELSKKIGNSRVYSGVHFPSDVEAGRLISEKLKNNQ